MIRKLWIECEECGGVARQNVFDITDDEAEEVDVNMCSGTYTCEKCGTRHYVEIEIFLEKDEDWQVINNDKQTMVIRKNAKYE